MVDLEGDGMAAAVAKAVCQAKKREVDSSSVVVCCDWEFFY